MNMSYPTNPGRLTADEQLHGVAGARASSGTGTDASALAAEAGDATRHVAGVAKDETRSVASEAGRQARRFAGRVQSEVRQQAATQQTRAAEGLRSTASSFSRMADSPEATGYAPELVRAAGDRIDAAGRWLEARDPGSLVEEVKSFARRRPGVFLAIAAGAGVVIGRLTRALATPSDDTDRLPAMAPGTTPGSTTPPVTPPHRVQPPAATTVGTGGVTGTGVGVGSPLGARGGVDASGQGYGLPSESGAGDLR